MRGATLNVIAAANLVFEDRGEQIPRSAAGGTLQLAPDGIADLALASPLTCLHSIPKPLINQPQLWRLVHDPLAPRPLYRSSQARVRVLDPLRGGHGLVSGPHWSFLHQLVGFMAEMGHLGVGLYLHLQALDTSTPAGKAMLNMCSVFAEFEREMIVERVNARLRRARAQGKRLGRPRIGDHVEAAVRRLRGRGSGIKAIARELNIGVSVVQRVVHAE
jgi:hypothetical protein